MLINVCCGLCSQLRTKALEQQLAEVKLKQQQELFAQEEAKSHLYTEQIAQLLKTEQDLRSQLGLYGDKFEQFQVCLQPAVCLFLKLTLFVLKGVFLSCLFFLTENDPFVFTFSCSITSSLLLAPPCLLCKHIPDIQ